MIIYFLKNFLYYFLPIAVTWAVGVPALPKLKRKKEFVLWGNIGLLVIVIIISFITTPSAEPLQVEMAFYSLTEQPDETYKLHNLLDETSPKYLGVKDSLGHLKGLPTVNSGDELQLRLKLNQTGYAYVFHFDTTAMTLRQLFPAQEIAMTNPLPAESWLELPSTIEAWPLDSTVSIEVFLIFVSKSESDEVQINLNRVLERLKTETIRGTNMIQKLQQELAVLGSYFSVRDLSNQLSHGIHNATPTAVKTRTFRGREEKTVLFWQLIRHN